MTQRSPCYSAVSALFTNPLPDRSNYSPVCHTHYLTLDQYFTSSSGQTLYQAAPLETNTLLRCSSLLRNLVGNSEKRSALRKLNNKQRHPSMFLILLFKSLTQFPFVSFFSILLSQSSLFSLHHPFFLFWSSLCLPKTKTSSIITFCFTNGTYFCILFHTMTCFL